MKGKTRKLVIILLACVFAASAGMIIYLQALAANTQASRIITSFLVFPFMARPPLSVF